MVKTDTGAIEDAEKLFDFRKGCLGWFVPDFLVFFELSHLLWKGVLIVYVTHGGIYGNVITMMADILFWVIKPKEIKVFRFHKIHVFLTCIVIIVVEVTLNELLLHLIHKFQLILVVVSLSKQIEIVAFLII